jgi:hypothetical protein
VPGLFFVCNQNWALQLHNEGREALNGMFGLLEAMTGSAVNVFSSASDQRPARAAGYFDIHALVGMLDKKLTNSGQCFLLR